MWFIYLWVLSYVYCLGIYTESDEEMGVGQHIVLATPLCIWAACMEVYHVASRKLRK